LDTFGYYEEKNTTVYAPCLWRSLTGFNLNNVYNEFTITGG